MYACMYACNARRMGGIVRARTTRRNTSTYTCTYTRNQTPRPIAHTTRARHEE